VLKDIARTNGSIITTRKFIEQQPVVIEQVVKSVIEGMVCLYA
jgi:hypothetical protein